MSAAALRLTQPVFRDAPPTVVPSRRIPPRQRVPQVSLTTPPAAEMVGVAVSIETSVEISGGRSSSVSGALTEQYDCVRFRAILTNDPRERTAIETPTAAVDGLTDFPEATDTPRPA
jgi:hypothetical protein